MELKISENLKTMRKERGNTQDDLANHLGISVQAVSKWERGDGFPDITLLPRIASFYDTTVDALLGCDTIRKHEDMKIFAEKAQILINQGKRKERLELCRAYQKKYPHEEAVLYELMYDLFAVSWKENCNEIISIATKLLGSQDTERHFGAVQLLAFTHAKLGNYEAAVKYARSIPNNRDILCNILKGEELIEHCRWFFWQVCDKIYKTECALTQSTDYTAEERHKIKKTVYDVFHVVFSDGDFGFWEERLARICYEMATLSAEIGAHERAIAELDQMYEHTEKFHEFVSIDHTSPLVRGLHYDVAQSGKSSEESLAEFFLFKLNNSKNFAGFENDSRFTSVKEKLGEII